MPNPPKRGTLSGLRPGSTGRTQPVLRKRTIIPRINTYESKNAQIPPNSKRIRLLERCVNCNKRSWSRNASTRTIECPLYWELKRDDIQLYRDCNIPWIIRLLLKRTQSQYLYVPLVFH